MTTCLLDQPLLAICSDEDTGEFWARTEGESTTKQRSIVEHETQTPKIDTQPVQGGLSGLAEDRAISRIRRPPERIEDHQSATLIDLFYQRVLARWSKPTAGQYRWVLRSTLELATTLVGHSVSIEELLRDEQLLGQTLASPANGTGTCEVSGWLTSQRRSVLRAFANLMASELRHLGLVSVLPSITSALRRVATPVGTGYKLPIGTPRGRGGPTPSLEEVGRITQALGQKVGWQGLRNRLVVLLMTRRGQRIGGLLRLDGANVHRPRPGDFRFILQTKSARQPYELVVPADIAELVKAYIDSFNQWARSSGLSDRIGVNVPGFFWRGDRGDPLTYQAWSRELQEACMAAGVPAFTSHAFRRAFATEATKVAPRRIAAEVGNWTSTRRMDDHYVQRLALHLPSSQLLEVAKGSWSKDDESHGQPALVRESAGS